MSGTSALIPFIRVESNAEDVTANDAFSITDTLKAFVKGDPEGEETIGPRLVPASSDRVTIDAVGVAALRLYRSTREVMEGRFLFRTDKKGCRTWGRDRLSREDRASAP